MEARLKVRSRSIYFFREKNMERMIYIKHLCIFFGEK
jgi:hypothetical protein